MAEQSTNTEQVQEELSAYLDGELDAQSVREVELRLARDAAYRQELQRLERAWDMLDGLPRAAVGDSFTRTTIEMVAVAAADEVKSFQEQLPRRRRSRNAIAGGLAVAAGVVGFALGLAWWPDPNRQLLDDLKVLQNFEYYYQADDFDFLKQLDRESLFADGENDHAS
ncbi:MAG TPA: zf-HC2 domain-containing protein [Pirellulales bacterium]|jgi:anti-sigma factor RsiW